MGCFLDGYAMVLDSAGDPSAEVARRTIAAVPAEPILDFPVTYRIVGRVNKQRGIPEE
jgi:hypothetical protein